MNARKLLVGLAVILAVGILPQGALAAGPNITFTTEPTADEIIPDDTLSTVRISVEDEQGNPIPNVKIGFGLKAPSPGLLFSSDFPIVEGTDLMTYELVATDGVLEFEYLWPIRGSYAAVLSAAPTALSPVQFEPIRETVEIKLSENPAEFTNLIFFVVVLGLFGLVSGLVLGRSIKTTREAE